MCVLQARVMRTTRQCLHPTAAATALPPTAAYSNKRHHGLLPSLPSLAFSASPPPPFTHTTCRPPKKRKKTHLQVVHVSQCCPSGCCRQQQVPHPVRTGVLTRGHVLAQRLNPLLPRLTRRLGKGSAASRCRQHVWVGERVQEVLGGAATVAAPAAAADASTLATAKPSTRLAWRRHNMLHVLLASPRLQPTTAAGSTQ